jgi:hypothetical protein
MTEPDATVYLVPLKTKPIKDHHSYFVSEEARKYICQCDTSLMVDLLYLYFYFAFPYLLAAAVNVSRRLLRPEAYFLIHLLGVTAYQRTIGNFP